MSDLIVFVVIVAAMAGVGMAIGIIVAGRMDRIMAPRSAPPPPSPAETGEPRQTGEPQRTSVPLGPPAEPAGPEEEQP